MEDCSDTAKVFVKVEPHSENDKEDCSDTAEIFVKDEQLFDDDKEADLLDVRIKEEVVEDTTVSIKQEEALEIPFDNGQSANSLMQEVGKGRQMTAQSRDVENRVLPVEIYIVDSRPRSTKRIQKMDEENEISDKLQWQRELHKVRMKRYRERKRMKSQQVNSSMQKMGEENEISDELQWKRELHKERMKRYRERKRMKSQQVNSSMQNDPNKEMKSMRVQEKIAERKRALAKERSRRYRERKRLNALQSVNNSQTSGPMHGSPLLLLKNQQTTIHNS